MDRTFFVSRFLIATCLTFLVLLSPGGSRAAQLSLSLTGAGSGPGNDPLVDPNSWFVIPDPTGSTLSSAKALTSASTVVTLSSGDSVNHTVQVIAKCCFNTATSSNVTLPGLKITLTAPASSVVTGAHPQFTSQAQKWCYVMGGAMVCQEPSTVGELVNLPAGGSVSLTLTVTAEGAVTPGRYMISVGAASKDNPQVIAGNVGPILNVMPALAVDNAETPEDCPPSSGSQDITAISVGSPPGSMSYRPPLEVLILRPMIRDFFNRKATSPTQTMFNGGILALTGMAGWQITVAAPATPLPPTMTSITLANEMGWDKMLVPFNGSVCPHNVLPTMDVPVNTSMTTTVDLTKATSVLLRRQACGNWIGLVCADKSRWTISPSSARPTLPPCSAGER
jgi:hypothetical protein